MGLSVGEQFQAGNERQESLAACLLYELILESKMTIESPVSKSRSGHHSRQSRLADSIGRELGACRFRNSLAVLAVSTFDLRIVLGLPWRDLALGLVVSQQVEGLALPEQRLNAEAGTVSITSCQWPYKLSLFIGPRHRLEV